MPHKSPLAVVNETFGGKDKLVDKLSALLEADESKEELKKRLLGVANTKLLRLHRIASAVKEKFGSRDKLLASTVSALGRAKDKDYVGKLETYSTARLLDTVTVAQRKTQKAGAPVMAKAPAVKPAKAAAKAGGKAAAAAKPAAKSTKAGASKAAATK